MIQILDTRTCLVNMQVYKILIFIIHKYLFIIFISYLLRILLISTNFLTYQKYELIWICKSGTPVSKLIHM